MTDLKFKLLSALYDEYQPIHENNLLNKFPEEIMQAKAALEDLDEDRLIEYDVYHVRCTITKSGRAALEMSQEARSKDAENKRDQSSQHKLQATQILISLFIFVFGMIVDHFGSIIDWFLSLFH